MRGQSPPGHRGITRGAARVRAAADGLTLTDNRLAIPKNFGQPGSGLPTPSSFNVDGVDTSRLALGPLSAASVSSGRTLRSSDAHANVAVMDYAYAKAHKLKTGGTITIAKTKFTIAGIVTQQPACPAG